MSALEPKPVEQPFPSPDPDARLAPHHKVARVLPPFVPARMGMGRPDHKPLKKPDKP